MSWYHSLPCQQLTSTSFQPLSQFCRRLLNKLHGDSKPGRDVWPKCWGLGEHHKHADPQRRCDVLSFERRVCGSWRLLWSHQPVPPSLFPHRSPSVQPCYRWPSTSFHPIQPLHLVSINNHVSLYRQWAVAACTRGRLVWAWRLWSPQWAVESRLNAILAILQLS